MYTNRIVALVVVVLIVLDMIWFVIKIVIYAMSLGLLVVACFREFGLVGNIGFSGCALLAVEITNRYFLSKTNEYDEEPSQEQ